MSDNTQENTNDLPKNDFPQNVETFPQNVEMPYKRLVDFETGDMIKVTQYRTVEQQYCINKNKENKRLSQFDTNFVWILFQYGESLFPNVSVININRLICLSTYCKKDGSLMKKDIIADILKLSKHQWYDFWDDMIKNNILYEEKNIVFINPGICKKGKLTSDNNYTRLFCNCIRTLYDSCTDIKMQKQLSYIYKIIPFVNRRTNIISKNPEEQDIGKIQYMTLGEFCDNIGYDRSQARRLLNDLLKIRIQGQKVIWFLGQDLNKETWYLVVNPLLYYGGKNDDIYKKQLSLFSSMCGIDEDNNDLI